MKIRSILTGCCAGLAALSLTTESRAAPIAVVNPSFESQVTPPDSFITNVAPTGWQAYGAINFGGRTVGVLNPNTSTLYADPVPDGNNVGVVFLMDNQGNQTQFNNSEAGLRQTLSSTLQTLTQYTLIVEVGNIAVDANAPFLFNGFPNYRIDLMAGGTVLASDNDTLLPGEGRFLTSNVSFTTGAAHALAGQSLGIRLVNLNSDVGIEVNFDNVRLNAVSVPEPGSMALIAAGLIALCARRQHTPRRPT